MDQTNKKHSILPSFGPNPVAADFRAQVKKPLGNLSIDFGLQFILLVHRWLHETFVGTLGDITSSNLVMRKAPIVLDHKNFFAFVLLSTIIKMLCTSILTHMSFFKLSSWHPTRALSEIVAYTTV